MSGKKLTDIMSNYLTQGEKSPRSRVARYSFLNEVSSCHTGDLPVKAHENSWSILSNPEKLTRTFEFDCILARNDFISEILAYEKEYGHYGKLTVDGGSVNIEVYTHDLNMVTDLDKDYAKQCDEIFVEVGHWGS